MYFANTGHLCVNLLNKLEYLNRQVFFKYNEVVYMLLLFLIEMIEELTEFLAFTVKTSNSL